jgi:hypothetical protein
MHPLPMANRQPLALSLRLLSLKILQDPAGQMFPIGQSQSRGLNAASSLPKRVSLFPVIFFPAAFVCL